MQCQDDSAVLGLEHASFPFNNGHIVSSAGPDALHGL